LDSADYNATVCYCIFLKQRNDYSDEPFEAAFLRTGHCTRAVSRAGLSSPVHV